MGSIAHVEMLFKQKIITFKIKNKIIYGLKKITVLDLDKNRLSIAKKVGADNIILVKNKLDNKIKKKHTPFFLALKGLITPAAFGVMVQAETCRQGQEGNSEKHAMLCFPRSHYSPFPPF